jgi:hypothetical protein
MKFKNIIGIDDLFIARYNNTWINERGIEIIHALNFITNHGPIIEVGAVLPYYGFYNHICYDPYDPHPIAQKIDAEITDLTGQNVVCISSIEHFGTDSYCKDTPVDNDKPARFLEKLHRESKSYFVTFPGGYNFHLQDYLKKNRDKYQIHGYIKTQQDPPIWVYTNDLEKLGSVKYHTPFPNGNSIIFVIKE